MSDSRKATDKPASGERERNIAKDADRVDDASRTSSQPTFSMSRATEEKVKGPSRNMNNAPANAQSANELRAEPPKTVGGVASTAESPQMLSVGGHKFRRQGNSWIDQKFKSSMTLKIVSRNSDEFAALNSGVRSIAQQLSGHALVWLRSAERLVCAGPGVHARALVQAKPSREPSRDEWCAAADAGSEQSIGVRP